jgi:hypothetical protein
MDDPATEGIDDAVAELLALTPESFTARRNALAKELRAAGRRDAAEAVKALPRPPLALWALNRLAREQPALIDAFLAASDTLRDAYRRGGDIRAATQPERDAEARVVACATEVALAHGRSVTDSVLRGLGQTVHAAAASAEVGQLLRDGRLIREPVAPSISELLGTIPETSAAAAPASGSATNHGREAERRELREQIADAEADARRARSQEHSAALEAREAHRAWEAARVAAEETQRSREEVDKRLDALRERLERL